MYEAFYGLRERPFNLTPDPKYLYLSEKHKEAFAHLLFGIKNRSGFVMVTGEIGTGKTTICRNLLNQLDPNTEVAFIFNPALNPVELLKKINAEFGISSAADNVLDLAEELNQYLLKATAAGKNCVLVIDEAQNLAPAVLEQVRLLSNLETEKEKLLQIILIGQPELGEKLALHELRQLNQRITARYHLQALNAQEARQYVAYRIHVAGGRKSIKFTRSAFNAIFRHSGGTPRVINAICDRALLIGYTKEAHTISRAIVNRAAREVRGARIGRRQALRRASAWVPSPLAIFAALLIFVPLMVAAIYLAQPMTQLAREIGRFNALMTAPVPAESPSRDGAVEAAPVTSARPAGSVAAARASDDKPLAQVVVERIADTQAAPSVLERIGALDPAAARATAVSALAQLWKLDPAAALPASDAYEEIQAYFRSQSLSCDRFTPALDQLLAVNLPALVRVKQGERSMWLALVGIEADRLRITLANEETATMAREEFARIFRKEAIFPWRDPSPNAPALIPGRSGPAVARLKEQLRALGRLPESNRSDAYDAATAAAISTLQSETGLLLDGMTGPQVRMVLSAWFPESTTPVLQRPEASTLDTPQAHANNTGDAAAPKSANPPPPTPAANSQPAPEAPGKEAADTTPLPVFAPMATPEAPPADTAAPPVPDAHVEQVRVQELPKPAQENAATGYVPAAPASESTSSVTDPVIGSAPLVPREGR
jgi:general secretion pathway protein A